MGYLPCRFEIADDGENQIGDDEACAEDAENTESFQEYVFIVDIDDIECCSSCGQERNCEEIVLWTCLVSSEQCEHYDSDVHHDGDRADREAEEF